MERDEEERQAWCAECVQEYGFPVETVDRVLAGLKDSTEAAQILLEACSDCGLDPISTMDEALRAGGAFRIARPSEPPPQTVANSRQTQFTVKPRASTVVGESAPEAKSELELSGRMTGMAAEICLALLRQGGRLE